MLKRRILKSTFKIELQMCLRTTKPELSVPLKKWLSCLLSLTFPQMYISQPCLCFQNDCSFWVSSKKLPYVLSKSLHCSLCPPFTCSVLTAATSINLSSPLYSQTINVNSHCKGKPSSSEYTMLKQKANFSACAPLYKQEEVFLKLSSVEVDIWYVDGPR